MATAFVQSVSTFTGAGRSSTLAVAFATNVTSGNLIPVFAGHAENATATLINTITDTLGNTYTFVARSTTNVLGEIWYAKNIAGGANTVTVTFTASPQYRYVLLHEVSGADTVAPLDGNAIQDQLSVSTATDAITSGTFATSANGDYIFGATLDESASVLPLVGTGFTGLRESDLGPGADRFGSEDQIQSVSGSIAVTFTSTSANQQWKTGGMAFKPAAAAASVVSPRLMALLGVGA